MDLLRAYNKDSRQHEESRQEIVDSKKESIQHIEESRQHVACSRQGKTKGFLSTVYRLLSTVYCLLSTNKNSLSTVYCPLSTERGIALVMTLVISAIALAIMAGLIYMITVGTQISGIQKRYKTAHEAGLGGAEVAYAVIGARGDPKISGINFSQAASNDCLTAKLNTAWSTANWAACGNFSDASSLTIDRNNSNTYDWTLELGAAPFPIYRVYAKIVDTVEGNSGGDAGLVKGGVVSSGVGEVTVQSRPYLYTIEIDAQDRDNPAERAKASILYQY